MFTSNERGIRKQAQVDFTRSGWRQFFKLNRSLGARFIRGFVLRYITDIFAAEETVAYEPVFFWQKIRRGADFILAHVLSGWRQLTERMVLSICYAGSGRRKALAGL